MLKKNILKEKKADVQQMQFFLMYIVFSIIILIFLLYFVHNSLTVEGSKSKILAKEVALLVDFAKPGTVINVASTGFVVSLDETNREINVKAEKKLTSYSYDYFNSNKIEITRNETNTFIKIS